MSPYSPPYTFPYFYLSVCVLSYWSLTSFPLSTGELQDVNSLRNEPNQDILSCRMIFSIIFVLLAERLMDETSLGVCQSTFLMVIFRPSKIGHEWVRHDDDAWYVKVLYYFFLALSLFFNNMSNSPTGILTEPVIIPEKSSRVLCVCLNVYTEKLVETTKQTTCLFCQ